jgi:hypothetical protein
MASVEGWEKERARESRNRMDVARSMSGLDGLMASMTHGQGGESGVPSLQEPHGKVPPNPGVVVMSHELPAIAAECKGVQAPLVGGWGAGVGLDSNVDVVYNNNQITPLDSDQPIN